MEKISILHTKTKYLKKKETRGIYNKNVLNMENKRFDADDIAVDEEKPVGEQLY